MERGKTVIKYTKESIVWIWDRFQYTLRFILADMKSGMNQG